jgi:hypothetical protein
MGKGNARQAELGYTWLLTSRLGSCGSRIPSSVRQAIPLQWRGTSSGLYADGLKAGCPRHALALIEKAGFANSNGAGEPAVKSVSAGVSGRTLG